ncbi:hypothetical protein GCM10016272_02680 [Psychrobacter glaciei]|uniref:VWFA domain-containing protein n=1 Tax=Psychrobacter glaciei TaxID=619771 RepID=A0ABQ3GMG9_9GAMM|nr:hypothetical protein GCM10016272_02680 [Psychrobacter glaciei]
MSFGAIDADEDVTIVVLIDSIEFLGMADLARDKLAERIVRFFCDNHQFCRASVLIYG